MLPSPTQSAFETSFEMPLRDPAPIPPASEFIRFLASSLTFMVHLSEVSVYFDKHCLTKLTKASGIPKPLSIPTGLTATSPQSIMTVEAIKSTPLHVKAEVKRWVYSMSPPKPVKYLTGGFFSSVLNSVTPQRSLSPLPSVGKAELLEISTASVSLDILAADVDVRLDRKTKDELR